ncbi:V-set domain-containing T-cell activation inhibitor 1-like [Mixophyes fleayi]|uniref:V-set domain-containing T-cell activation inhibitor 1-like n=1 Tax=Mixophyes fleayi TaxID=3061075 RepID=UPI003F4DA3EF
MAGHVDTVYQMIQGLDQRLSAQEEASRDPQPQEASSGVSPEQKLNLPDRFSGNSIVIIIALALALGLGFSVVGHKTHMTTVNALGLIGNNVTLSCTFTHDEKESSNILWRKEGETGIVYKYKNGNISLTDQNELFKHRTSLFLEELAAGNASLQITNVQITDAGVYYCIITNSKGREQHNATLKVGAFTEVTVTNTSETTIHCDSLTWYPEPTVTWLNVTAGSVFTNPNTTYSNSTYETNTNFSGAMNDMKYRCVIQNYLAHAEGDALFTDVIAPNTAPYTFRGGRERATWM